MPSFTSKLRNLGLIALFILGSAVSSEAAIAFVQATSGGPGGPQSSVTTAAFGSTPTAGNLIVCAGSFDGAATISSVTSSTSNTWNFVGSLKTDSRSSDNHEQHFYAMNIAVGASFTVTMNLSAGAFGVNIACAEYSGAATTLALDGEATANETAGTSAASNSYTTVGNGELIFASVFISDGTSGSFTQGSGYTERAEATGDTQDLEIEDQIQTSAGSISATWTQSNSQNSLALLSSFKPVAVGGQTNLNGLLTLGVGK